jgi:hypothetical protein
MFIRRCDSDDREKAISRTFVNRNVREVAFAQKFGAHVLVYMKKYPCKQGISKKQNILVFF